MGEKSVQKRTLLKNIEVFETEHDAQVRVVKALRRQGVLFCAVPNGGLRQKFSAVRLKREGVVPGVPDLLIFTLPPEVPGGTRGVAIEMKTKRGRVSEEQKAFHALLRSAGWLVFVCRGSEEALGVLERLGYFAST